MLRSISLAIGVFLLILGGQSLIVDKIVMAEARQLPKAISGSRYPNGANGNNVFRNAGYQQPYYQNVSSGVANLRQPKRVFQTKEWMPWSLLAAGTIIVLYTYSLPESRSESSD